MRFINYLKFLFKYKLRTLIMNDFSRDNINMSFDNQSNQMDINRNGNMHKRDFNINSPNNMYSPKQNRNVDIDPKLNVVRGGQVPDIGLDLIMNKKSHKHNSPVYSENSQIFGDNESVFSSEKSAIPNRKKKSFFVNNQESSDEEESVSAQSSIQQHHQHKPRVTEEDLLNEKKKLLYEFDRLRKKGIMVPKQYSLNSDLEEMKLDYETLKKDREVDASVAFQRKMLMAFASGTEFLNTKFDPFDVKLDGWSESLSNELNSYDDIFEELHEKYSGSSKLAPEFRLLFSVGGSAFLFNLTQKMFSNNLPNVNDVFRQNPDLARQFGAATMANLAQSGNKEAASFNNLYQSAQKSGQMKGPSQIDEILRDLEGDDLDEKIENLSTFSDSDISSEISINDLLSNKKNKKKGRSLNI
jgi:hypothetical protein